MNGQNYVETQKNPPVESEFIKKLHLGEWDVAQLVEYMTSVQEALSLTPSNTYTRHGSTYQKS